MSRPSASAPAVSNDGGIVVALFLMVLAKAVVMFGAVAFYANASNTSQCTDAARSSRLLRLLSGWANLGNAAVHALLVMYTVGNAGDASEYWIKEREIGGVAGPVVLASINLALGLVAVLQPSAWGESGMCVCVGWNTFVAVVGTAVPVVWPRFLAEGLASWPYPVVWIWLTIYACELTALVASMTWYALSMSLSRNRKRAEKKR